MTKSKSDLHNVKRRLESLPGLRVAAKRSQKYTDLLESTERAKAIATSLSAALTRVRPHFPSVTGGTTSAKLSEMALKAQRLRDRLDKEPELVTDDKTEKDVVLIGELAKGANQALVDEWDRTVGASFPPRETIATVLERVLPKEGTRIKRQVASGSQLGRTVPKSESDAERLAELIADIDVSFTKIGLKNEVGKFLRESATETGASLSDFSSPPIKEFIETHGLANSFRVKIG